MLYPFPLISESCPLCSRSKCARWKGYYSRRMICPEMEFIGPVAIHVGHCKIQGQDFSLLPSFLLPGQQISRLGLIEFLMTWKKDHNVSDAREQFADAVAATDSDDGGSLGDKESRYVVPRSTAYQWLYSLIVRLRLHSGLLQIEPPQFFSVFELKRLTLLPLISILEIVLPWRVASKLILVPP